MKHGHGVVAVVMISVFGCVPVAYAAEKVGIVTFTVDSVTQDFYQHRFPVFVQHSIPGTLYVQTDPIDTGAWGMDWDDLRDIASSGWEIGAHSYSHEHMLTQADDDRLDLELGAPAAHIYREIGVYPATFATPFGDYDDRVLERTRLFYDAHLGAWGNEGVNYFDQTDHYRINRIEVFYHQSVEEICTNIERAGTEGYWLVLMLHEIVDGVAQEYQIAHSTLEGILACAATLRDTGVIRVLHAQDALKLVPHTVQ